MAKMLVAYFNDSDDQNTSTLSSEIKKLSGINNLTYPPKITCGDVDEQAANFFNNTKLVPTFSFIDPFGYRGLSLSIIKGVIKDWGCDCVFFFNYGRINAGINNPKVVEHMDSLFGKERAEALRRRLPELTPSLREPAILEALAEEIKGLGGTFVLPFTFKNEAGTRTSHKFIFVSKNFRGYEVMKSVMAGESSTEDEGVPSFTYSPADASMPLLFSLSEPLSKLIERLPREYAGRSLKRRQLYEKDSVDRPYMEKHYTAALKQLEENGLISVNTTKSRKRGTFPPHVTVHFPKAS